MEETKQNDSPGRGTFSTAVRFTRYIVTGNITQREITFTCQHSLDFCFGLTELLMVCLLGEGCCVLGTACKKYTILVNIGSIIGFPDVLEARGRPNARLRVNLPSARMSVL